MSRKKCTARIRGVTGTRLSFCRVDARPRRGESRQSVSAKWNAISMSPARPEGYGVVPSLCNHACERPHGAADTGFCRSVRSPRSPGSSQADGRHGPHLPRGPRCPGPIHNPIVCEADGGFKAILGPWQTHNRNPGMQPPLDPSADLRTRGPRATSLTTGRAGRAGHRHFVRTTLRNGGRDGRRGGASGRAARAHRLDGLGRSCLQIAHNCKE
jgi:hypothetical protein